MTMTINRPISFCAKPQYQSESKKPESKTSIPLSQKEMTVNNYQDRIFLEKFLLNASLIGMALGCLLSVAPTRVEMSAPPPPINPLGTELLEKTDIFRKESLGPGLAASSAITGSVAGGMLLVDQAKLKKEQEEA